jgi:hypothetical protein
MAFNADFLQMLRDTFINYSEYSNFNEKFKASKHKHLKSHYQWESKSASNHEMPATKLALDMVETILEDYYL